MGDQFAAKYRAHKPQPASLPRHADAVADERPADPFCDPGRHTAGQRRVAKDEKRGGGIANEGRQDGRQSLRPCVRQLRAVKVEHRIGTPLRELRHFLGDRFPDDQRPKRLLRHVRDALELRQQLATDPAERPVARFAENEDATAHLTPPYRTLASSRRRRANSRAASSGESDSMTRPAPRAGGTVSPSTCVRTVALTAPGSMPRLSSECSSIGILRAFMMAGMAG